MHYLARYLVLYFYPRPPRGGRQTLLMSIPPTDTFLSTPSARRATDRGDGKGRLRRHFYPRPPRGGRLWYTWGANQSSIISIHALREEGDSSTNRSGAGARDFYPRPPRGGRRSRPLKHLRNVVFLSTPSARRATNARYYKSKEYIISIHALREEGDSKNREKTLCFCLIIHLSAQIAKRCL